MRYRNVKTGAVIDVPSKLGGNWEKIGGGESEKAPAVFSEPTTVEEVKPVTKKTKKTASKTKK